MHVTSFLRYQIAPIGVSFGVGGWELAICAVQIVLWRKICAQNIERVWYRLVWFMLCQ